MLCCPHCSMLSTILNKLLSLNPAYNRGVTMLNNIVDNIEQYGQHNIVQACFQQLEIFCRVEIEPISNSVRTRLQLSNLAFLVLEVVHYPYFSRALSFLRRSKTKLRQAIFVIVYNIWQWTLYKILNSF